MHYIFPWTWIKWQNSNNIDLCNIKFNTINTIWNPINSTEKLGFLESNENKSIQKQKKKDSSFPNNVELRDPKNDVYQVKQ